MYSEKLLSTILQWKKTKHFLLVMVGCLCTIHSLWPMSLRTRDDIGHSECIVHKQPTITSKKCFVFFHCNIVDKSFSEYIADVFDRRPIEFQKSSLCNNFADYILVLAR